MKPFNLNKVGKILLGTSLIIAVLHIADLFFIGAIMNNLPGVLQAVLLIICFFFFCISFGFIYYNSEAPKRKPAITTLSIVSVAALLTGIIFKLLWWRGASAMIIFSVFLFSFSALPLIVRSRYEKRKTLLSNRIMFLSILDLASVIFICMGLMFRVMHWPGGTHLLILGPVLLLTTLILWNVSFRREVKLRFEAEEKLKSTLKEIEEKHHIIEEKNKEITDSITYARRIQQAIMPPMDFIRNYVPEFFIYYRPKDIVAGDFYWAERLDNIFLMAAADCTGHGVPGALVSVVCSNALNRSVKEFRLTEPGSILDKTRELVLENFSKSKEAIKDGMDISLISIEKTSDGYTVKWAGANNPLWYMHHSVSSSSQPAVPGENNAKSSGTEYELTEIKADKQPIGFTDEPRPFTTHTIQAKRGDLFYLFTDGYADQFGGPKGKKFKYRQFEELVQSVQHQAMDAQKAVVDKSFQDWRGSLEQIDDVCVIGMRL